MSANLANSKQLVSATLAGQLVPRAVSGPLAVHWCAKSAGTSLRDYTLNSQVLADCVIRYWEHFRPDAIWLSADTWVSAQAMGAAVAFPGDDQPLGGTGEPLVRCASDIERIPPPDPATQGRYPLMLDALQRIKRAIGDEVFIVACFDQYPFSLACALMGIERAMTAAIEQRALLESLMDRCSEYTIAYAPALAHAGADMLSGGDSPAGLLGPRLYRELALPYEQRVIDAIKSYVLLPVSLHICGNTTSILSDMAQAGADVLELDHQVGLSIACRAVGPDTTIWGNLDPVALLARATPREVQRATRAAFDQMKACGHRKFVLSSGCTLALQTPEVNVRAMLDAARNCLW